MAQTNKRGPGRPPGSTNKKASASSGSRSAQVPKTKEEHIEEMRLKYEKDKRTFDVIWSITLVAVGVFLLCTVVRKSTGTLGIMIHDICLGLFGFMGYVLPFMFILFGILLMIRKLQHINARTSTCGVLFFLQLCILNSYRFIDEKNPEFGFDDIVKYYKLAVDGKQGGAIGMELGSLLVEFMGKAGLVIVAVSILLICLFLVADTPISKFFQNIHNKRETRKMMEELEAAERAKVQQAVASTAFPEPVTFRELDRAFKSQAIAEPQKFVEPENLTRSVDLKDTFVTTPDYGKTAKPAVRTNEGFFSRLKRNTLFSAPVDVQKSSAGKYDAEEVGSSLLTQEESQNKGYGLNDTQSKDSGEVSYGLGQYDGYTSTGGKNAGYGLDDDYTSGKPARKGTKARSAADNSVENIDRVNEVSSDKSPRRAINKGKGLSDTENVAQGAVVAAAGVAVKNMVDNAVADKADNDRAATDSEAEKMGEELNAALNIRDDDMNYTLPPVSLLNKGSGNKQQMSDIQLEQKSDLLEQTLRDFGVEATVLEVTQGSSVTRYEVQPATGVKVSRISNLEKDIALNLRAKSIRIEAPIPGKAAVGIEVENEKPTPVVVRDLIESQEFADAKSKISFVVGKDISGKNIISNLKDMPHLLIAGATGSGKSVCINTIIASILYKAKPSEVKLIMVDPKVVELQAYNALPHMLVPVVTDPRKAAKALAIAVQEMDKRYDAFAKAGVKDLDSYNEYMRAEQEYANVKPQIVIIIDELADLMMACSNDVENSICRLAQKARAAGMHLIVATQRPSVDVVTGLIKANIPSRIALSVSSSIDSRTILDMPGAEKLLGKGDMLFSPVGATKPYRVQGPYITEAETDKVIEYVKQQVGDVAYDRELQDELNSDSTSTGGKGQAQDELTEDAVAFILKSKQASVSMLQRRFRIGYNRAARIIDEIEDMGIIGPSDGSRPRQVLISEDEYYGGEEFTDDNFVADEAAVRTEELSDDNSETPGGEYVTDVEDVETIPDDSCKLNDSGIRAFDSLPESVQQELLNSDD